jgi:hypothetical protein
MVGDRGMISQKAINALKERPEIDWLTALKSTSIRTLVGEGHVQMDLFDERNLFELNHPEYPGERLITCKNPALAELRGHKRESLLQATERLLEKVRQSVAKGRLQGQDKIGVQVGKVINRYNVAKHFDLDIEDDAFSFARRAESIALEAQLDGLYVIRKS